MRRALTADVEELDEGVILDAMNRAYDPEIHMVRDMRIDDSDIPFARNFYDYCNRVIGKSLKMPFARQMWISARLMCDMCPACTPAKYFDSMWDIPVDADTQDMFGSGRYVQMMNHGRCPKCGLGRGQAFKQGLMPEFTEAVWVLGQRSGKSTIASQLTTYAYHRYLKSPKLGRVAKGIQESTMLTSSFVALTTTNGYKLLWMPVRDTMVDSSWFQNYFKFLDAEGKKMGKELYQFNPVGTYFRSFLKMLDAFPSGPSKRALRGATRMWAVTDELGHFPFDPNVSEAEEGTDDRERANADEVHAVLTNSLLTVRGEVRRLQQQGQYTYPQGMNLSISSPLSWRDKVMRLMRDSQSTPSMFGVRAPTWEMTPLFPRDHPDIAAMYMVNPMKAERDFGANPPRISNEVFRKDMVATLFCGGRNEWAVRYEGVNDPTYTQASAVQMVEGNQLPPAVLTLDAGLSNNAFALTIMYPMTGQDSGKLRAPTVLEVVPRDGSIIDHVWLYENIIKRLIAAMNVREVFADRWNSVFILRKVQVDFPDQVKISQQYSLRGKDFDAFIAVANSGQLVLPNLDVAADFAESTPDYKRDLVRFPVGHLYRQFVTVTPYQGMLTKGSDSTDDIFRSLVLAVNRLSDDKIAERFREYPTVSRMGISAQAFAVAGSRILFPGQMPAIQQNPDAPVSAIIGRRFGSPF